MHTLTIIYILGIIGVIDTLYLIYHKVKGTEVACLFFPKAWCYTVQHSKQSKTFGIPNSYLGFVMYSALLVMTYLFSQESIPFFPIQALITFGFLFSMYFLYVQAFVLKAFCTWCVVSAINFTLLTLTVFL